MKRSQRRALLGLAAALLLIVPVGVWLHLQRPATRGEVGAVKGDAPLAPVKVLVAEEGIYELRLADLQKLNAGWRQVDPHRLRLTHRGRTQPLWVEADGRSFTLRFYARASDSRYSRENVYWLQVEPEDREAEEQEGRSQTPPSSSPCSRPQPGAEAADWAFAVVRAEENRRYEPRVEEGDHWFWASLPAPRTQAFTVPLRAVAPGPAELRLEMWGSTQAATAPDHHLRVAVNGQPVADEAWDGVGRHRVEAELPAGLLRDGDNTVRIEAPGDTGVAADITFVDWIEMRYPRFLVAEEDRLAFEGTGVPARLTGFSGPVTVVDVTQPEKPTRVVGACLQDQGSGTIVLRAEAGHRYLAVGPQGVKRPPRVRPAVTAPDLRVPDQGADYVAIGPPDLLAPLEPLLRWRESQGLRTLAVPVEAVYDQFNHGLPEPEAIRAFLKHAVQTWDPAPRYVLLVGDATFDPRGYQAPPEANRLPTFLISTVYGGETASDVLFAQVNDDPWPDLALGRIPARTPEQVRTVVEKTLAYEKGTVGGPWRRRVLAVADGQDPSFRAAAQAFLERFQSRYATELLAPAPGATEAHQEIRRRLEEGSLLVAYFGHGSVSQWGKDRLFSVADSTALRNAERLPVMLNFTCLTGLFTHPKVDSLAETLLWQPHGGAVALLAPTSLTLAWDQSFLSRPLAEAWLEGAAATLGELFLQAQRQVPVDAPGTRDVMQTFLLFGDPALRVANRS